jgi:hypothetical protein
MTRVQRYGGFHNAGLAEYVVPVNQTVDPQALDPELLNLRSGLSMNSTSMDLGRRAGPSRRETRGVKKSLFCHGIEVGSGVLSIR